MRSVLIQECKLGAEKDVLVGEVDQVPGGGVRRVLRLNQEGKKEGWGTSLSEAACVVG